MPSRILAPLRNSIGNPIKIKKISVKETSVSFKEKRGETDILSKNNLQDLLQKDSEPKGVYSDFLMPSFFGLLENQTGIPLPDPGSPELTELQESVSALLSDIRLATLPIPPDLPPSFRQSSNCTRIAATCSGVNDEISRSLWIELEIKLERSLDQLVGGICYSGYPYLPYYITSNGENSSNYGLPKEIRLSWGNVSGNEFIDQETNITIQESTSHSGVHFVCTDPIVTDTLTVRLTDFPKALFYQLQNNRFELLNNFRAILIPFLFVFDHSSKTRYSPRVSAGVLGAIQTPPNFNESFFEFISPK